MEYLSQIAFLLLSAASVYLFSRNIGRIRKNILMGKPEDLSEDPGKRWKNLMLFALGQQKMFRKPGVAIMHFIIYAGFIIINIEVLEIVLDGIFGTHRLFLKSFETTEGFKAFYGFLINTFEWLAVGVIAVCIAFLARRNMMKLNRFIHNDLDGWPRSDANYILITEIVLMSLFLIMNASDQVLQSRSHAGYTDTPAFFFSDMIAGLLKGASESQLVLLERFCWWLHIAGIFAFLNYLPYSKHLHILLAFPNTYYMRLNPQGQMENMENIQREVKLMMDPSAQAPETDSAQMKFGARDVFDLSWKSLLDAYSCTECGRCTSACPANMTGKQLSPRGIMMKTRDRLEEAGTIIRKNGEWKEDGKSLLHDYISTEELRACTSCNACVTECPVGINPLHIILELRRNLVMEESNAPQEWNGMFSNIENNFAPWKFSPQERADWTKS